MNDRACFFEFPFRFDKVWINSRLLLLLLLLYTYVDTRMLPSLSIVPFLNVKMSESPVVRTTEVESKYH